MPPPPPPRASTKFICTRAILTRGAPHNPESHLLPPTYARPTPTTYLERLSFPTPQSPGGLHYRSTHPWRSGTLPAAISRPHPPVPWQPPRSPPLRAFFSAGCSANRMKDKTTQVCRHTHYLTCVKDKTTQVCRHTHYPTALKIRSLRLKPLQVCRHTHYPTAHAFTTP